MFSIAEDEVRNMRVAITVTLDTETARRAERTKSRLRWRLNRASKRLRRVYAGYGDIVGCALFGIGCAISFGAVGGIECDAMTLAQGIRASLFGGAVMLAGVGILNWMRR